MLKTWRWFGEADKITLDMLRQIGVEGIVTALHHIPNGEVWSEEEIMRRKNFIDAAGLKWSVVESLAVSEAIKYAGSSRDQLIDNYIESLRNLGKCGIKTVCYNFMPVIDWVRTQLEYPWEDGASSLFFSHADFAFFDVKILQREGAQADYSKDMLEKIDEMEKTVSEEDKARLVDSIIVKTQCFVNGNISEDEPNPVAKFKEILALYKYVDEQKLRENMIYFLRRIMPVCNEYNINMCVHPDDPPFALLGLPRIVTCEEDIEAFLSAVDDPHNGLTLCAGSLSAGKQNDVPQLARRFASRTHFVHLRSTDVYPNGDFIEASHLGGRANLIEVIRIFERLRPELPMRVDHGRTILGDEKMGYNAGYSFLGRMQGLAQIEGVLAVVRDEVERNII